MNLTRTIAYFLLVQAMLSLPFAVSCQTNRWVLSYNPLGLLEWPTALGVGVGYRWNPHLELWSESSFLISGPVRTTGTVTGIKQILQGKFFPSGNEGLFFAMEVRYKSYQYRDTNVFINSAAHDTLYGFSNFSRHYFWGGALQIGWRTHLCKRGRLQLEIMAGLGIRKWQDVRQDVPPGYRFVDHWAPKDLNVGHIEYQIKDIYLPGSLRLIYPFGKRLRP